jgi:hypothetical protein
MSICHGHPKVFAGIILQFETLKLSPGRVVGIQYTYYIPPTTLLDFAAGFDYLNLFFKIKYPNNNHILMINTICSGRAIYYSNMM